MIRTRAGRIHRVLRPVVAGLAALLLLSGCERGASPDKPAARGVAVANSFLGAAVRELLPADATVVELAPPGTCPGHFDIRPSQIEALRKCHVLLRFGFQSGLDRKLGPLAEDGLLIQPITIERGLCTPAAYVDACRQVGAALTHKGLLTAAEHAERVTAVQERLAALTEEVQAQVVAAGLVGQRVITSPHQQDFCEFLGLAVVETIGGSDTASAGEINAALSGGGGVTAVIANLPEGRRLADALAARLDVPVVVLANFPDDVHHDGRFDALVRDNVGRLVQTLGQ